MNPLVTLLAQADAVRYFAPKLYVVSKGGLVMDAKADASFIEDIATSLARVGITLATGGVELATTILQPSASLRSCTAFPIRPVCSPPIFAPPSRMTLHVAELMLEHSHLTRCPSQ